MKVNMLQNLKDYTGKVINDGDGVPATFRGIAVEALNSLSQHEAMGSEQKAKIFQLSQHLFTGNDVELSLDQRSLIKGQVAKFYSALVYGRMCEILEVPADKE